MMKFISLALFTLVFISPPLASADQIKICGYADFGVMAEINVCTGITNTSSDDVGCTGCTKTTFVRNYTNTLTVERNQTLYLCYSVGGSTPSWTGVVGQDPKSKRGIAIATVPGVYGIWGSIFGLWGVPVDGTCPQ